MILSRIKNILVLIISFYSKYISYFFAPRCRFYPSCSQYASESLETHGLVVGSYYAIHRLLRCHPWCEGGFDPVPEKNCSCKNSGFPTKTDSTTSNLN